jgi:glycosyltransferase involved in cell wall biosynthesis
MAKIAFLIANLGGGGAERVAISLIEGFVRRGHQVDLLLMRKTGVFLDRVPAEVRVIDLGASRIRNVVRPLVRYLRDVRPDALQVSMWPLPVAALVAAALARTPTRIVVSEHCALSKQYEGSRTTLALLTASTRLFYRFADRIICVSNGVAKDLQNISGLAPNRVAVVYNPVEQATPARRPDPEALRAWPVARHRILSVGSLKAQKNQALLVEAFARVAGEIDASLLILGEGPERKSLEDLITALGMDDRIRLPGFVSDPSPYYAAASAFVLSSDYEGLPTVLIEALAWGLPVVSTDCDSGPAEILKNGEIGTLVPCGSPSALAAAVRETVSRRADKGLSKARASDFGEDEAVTRYLELMLG